MAAKKKEEEEKPKESSSDILGKALKTGKDYHYNFDAPENRIISTGSLILDSVIKIRAGSTVRMCGEGAELGKTSQCFVLASNYMATMPRSKTIFVAAESRLSPEMMARSGQKFVDKAEDWEYGTVFVLRSNIFDYVADILEKLMKKMKDDGEHLCIIIDSLDGLILLGDSEKSVGENQMVAGVPKLTKLFFRRVGLLNWAGDGLILVTSQYSTNIKIDTYAKDIPRQGGAAGGTAAGHQADYALLYLTRYKGDYILEDDSKPQDLIKNKRLGVYASIEIRKSATDETGTKVRVPIKKGRVGSQIWTEKEISDLVIAYGLIGRSGSWLKFDEDFRASALEEGIELVASVQGQNKLYEYLEENPEIRNWFKKKLEIYIS